MTFGSQATLFLDALSERRSESSYSLDLPTPSPLSPRLLRLGLDAKTAEAVSAAYFRGASDLKRKFEFEYASTCRALDATAGSKEFTKEFLPKLRATLVSKYCNALSGLVTQAAEKAKLHVSKIKKSFTQRTPTTRPPAIGLATNPPIHTPRSSISPLVFDVSRPPYAFPVAYPPQNGPTVALPTSFPTIPSRPPSSLYPRLRPSSIDQDVDIDALVSSFARLTISDRSPRVVSRRVATPGLTIPTLSSANKHPRTPLLRSSPKVAPSVSRPAMPVLTVSSPVQYRSPPPTAASRKHYADDAWPYRRKTSLPHRTTASPRRSSPIDCPFVSKSRTPSLVSDSGSEPSSPESQSSPTAPLRGPCYSETLGNKIHNSPPSNLVADHDFAQWWSPEFVNPSSWTDPFGFEDQNH